MSKLLLALVATLAGATAVAQTWKPTHGGAGGDLVTRWNIEIWAASQTAVYTPAKVRGFLRACGLAGIAQGISTDFTRATNDVIATGYPSGKTLLSASEWKTYMGLEGGAHVYGTLRLIAAVTEQTAMDQVKLRLADLDEDSRHALCEEAVSAANDLATKPKKP